MQAETGATAGSPHKGLVENLVEKAKEILPHQLTGVGPAPASTGNSAAEPYASRGDATVGALPSPVGLLYCDKAWLVSCCHTFGMPCSPCASLRVFPNQSGCQTMCMCLSDSVIDVCCQ